jgi:hypothetical protein
MVQKRIVVLDNYVNSIGEEAERLGVWVSSDECLNYALEKIGVCGGYSHCIEMTRKSTTFATSKEIA